MATIICISGTLSYSKYITNDNTSGGASAGSFTASASINGISALSFTNTAFWGGSAESDKIAMNALRQLKFSVNNYQTDSAGNKKVAEVRMRYNLVFSAPVVFASKLAFQVFNEHDVALLPQIVLADLLATTSGGTYDTSTSVDYNSQSVGDLTFTINKTTDEGETITAESSTTGVKITITTFEKDINQTLLFRLWDVSSLTNSSTTTVSNESGKILPPVTVNYTQKVKFYKISVTMPSFVLPAAVATTINHSIQLAPTSAIDDNQLGGSLVNVTQVDGNDVYTSVNPDSAKIDKSLYGPSGTTENVNQFAIETLFETVNDSYYENSTFSGESTKTESTTTKVTGNIQNYTVGSTTSSQYSYQTSKDMELTEEAKKQTSGTSTTTTTYVWDNYELTAKAKEYDTYLLAPDDSNATPKTYSNYRNTTNTYTDNGTIAGKYVDVGTANTDGTAFYIHKLAATQTGTEIISTITSRQLISKTQVTNTVVKETVNCTSIDGNQITLSVTKTTDVKVSENEVYRTISEETRTTVTRTGYVYRMYFLDSNFQKVMCISRGGLFDSFYKADVQTGDVNKITTSTINTAVTYQNQIMFYETTDGTQTTCKYFGDDGNNQYSSVETSTSQTMSNTTEILEQTEGETTTQNEYINRVITRTYNHSPINVSEISQTTSTIEGSTTTETKNVYTKDNPLNMYQKDSENKLKQIYYLSSSYSKNYPFYVDVIFEQVLE